MTKKIIIILFFLLVSSLSALADIDVVYPSSPVVTINAPSAFIFGNTDSFSKFYINDKPETLWNYNFFVKVIPLDYGENKVVLKSIHEGKTEEKTYIIKRNKSASSSGSKPNEYKPRNSTEYWYVNTIKDNATVRQKATIHSNRIIDLPQDTILYLSGKKGDYYKIEFKGETEFWIHKTNISSIASVSKKILPKLKKITQYEDKQYKYINFYLSYPTMYTIKQKDNSVEITIYGVETNDKEGNKQPNLKYIVKHSEKILGYDCQYKGNTLVFRSTKIPKIKDKNYPLKGLNIFVDAGHGGVEKGAVGPTRVNEKDINLDIANNLISVLKSEGANVTYSRNTDIKVGLTERVKKAKENNALISISIHNNSLPNGKDPYIQHGTEVHYYNENAKELASIIQTNLVKDLNLKDSGIHKSSFVLTRSTDPVSVLIEAAYIINPEEYILLQNPNFRKKIAQSVNKSIKEYIFLLQKN